MSLLDDLLAGETRDSIRAKVVGWAEAADLAITNWLSGGTSEQILQSMVVMGVAGADAVTKAIRGFASLDTATDPGDPDTFDPTNQDLEPAPGFLSHKGENDYGTPRREETFATGFVTFTNGGSVARTFGPETLTITWTVGSPPSPPPTYRNAADAAIYTNPDGTVTVPAGGTLTIPVVAEESGTRSNAPPGALSLTTVLSGCTATNAAAVVGTDREAAGPYRARCRQAGARVSLAGPGDAYRYLANTQLNGDPLLNASGNVVNINRVQVSQESATGIVDAFYAAPSGAPTAEDVDAANDNIEIQAFAVPDAITFTGAAATEVPVAVSGTAKVKAGPGVTVDAVKAAIVAKLLAASEDPEQNPIGGVDQVLGAGVIYTHDLRVIAGSAYPGLYDVVLSAPAVSSTAIAKGEVAVLTTAVGDWGVTIV